MVQRLLVVSNRLPVTISKGSAENISSFPSDQEINEDTWNFAMSSGGLVSALSGLKKDMSFTWIGWPGIMISAGLNVLSFYLGMNFNEKQQEIVKNRLVTEYSCVPVFVPDDLADLHYNGFSNSILWPLFHYLPGEINFDETVWSAYYQVNLLFAEAISKILEEGDLVWIQDYHLMLLPSLLRTAVKALRSDRQPKDFKIGFFLHTPFPSSEIYRVLPVRREILTGVLHADLIGFHTFDYARHFLSSCTRILGLATLPNAVEYEGRLVHVGTFPIGIDPEKFLSAMDSETVKEKVDSLKKRFEGKRLVVGVDRLDYIKGVPHKLHAFDLFLTKYPEFQTKVVLIQVAVPSRTDVEEYKCLRSTVNELVGKITGKFGTMEYIPVNFLYKSVPFDDLVTLYMASDCCIVSSTRDGMNLVSYEYIVCQRDNHGVLIMSEFAGAAQSMNGALIVNPWNTDEMATALHTALTMKPSTRSGEHAKLFKYVSKYTASNWGTGFVSELKRIGEELSQALSMPKLSLDILLDNLSHERQHKDCCLYDVVFVDYDGVLCHRHRFPDLMKPSEELLRVLDKISNSSKSTTTLIYLMSPRTRTNLDEWFANNSTGTIGLIAEHGCFYKHNSLFKESTSDSWNSLILTSSLDVSWKETIQPLLQHYAERTPGSFIEDKECSICWNYYSCDPEFGSWQAAELQVNLEKMLGHVPVAITFGNRAVEMHPSSVDKLTAIKKVLGDFPHQSINSITCICEGKESDSIYSFMQTAAMEQQQNKELPLPSLLSSKVITCTIGLRQSTTSQFYLESPDELIELLYELSLKIN